MGSRFPRPSLQCDFRVPCFLSRQPLLLLVALVLLLLLLIGVGVYIYQNFAGGGRYEKG